MMTNVHLAPSDDDDLYAGFGQEEVDPALQTDELEYDEVFQAALKTSVRPPGTSSGNRRMTGRLGTGAGMRTALRTSSLPPGTANRPMTGIRGAGYPGKNSGSRPLFDPLNASGRVVSSPGLETKKEETPEEKIRSLEGRINSLIEESCFASSRGEKKLALERAKESSTKERSLARLREQASLKDTHNLDLTFSVLFNFANQYALNEMYTEALNAYQVITKNRMFNNAGRLKVNMGNIYFKLGQYAKAIKFYRMALDQVPNTHKSMRIKIMQNIGILFVKMGQYSDACSSFEWIMSEQPDSKTGLHLILCYYAMGDKERTKNAFQQLLDVVIEDEEGEKYVAINDDPLSNLIIEAIKNDNLRRIERSKKQESEYCILTAAKLISPMIEDNYTQGYNWCVDSIKKSAISQLANDLEINKAVMYLKQKEFGQAVETLQAFEKQETKVASTAATNLSFIYFLQGQIDESQMYAEIGREADSYNAAAFVNLGNCCFQKGDYEKAKELYNVALENDASCIEALYNLGLSHKKLRSYEEALACFFKLHSIVRNYSHILYQIAHIYELNGDIDQSIEWYLKLLGLVPTDPVILHKLGHLFDNEGDKQQAYQYHYESYRYYPSNLEVIDWLGSYYIEMQISEKAIDYFERAALMQPDEVKWQLMIASCFRRSGNYHKALETYSSIHKTFPSNVECLKFLVKLCSDMGLPEASDYGQKLKRIEKSRNSGGSSSSRRASRNSSAVSEEARSLSGRRRFPASYLEEESLDEEFVTSSFKSGNAVESGYNDPLGPLPTRPKTGMAKNDGDDFGDDDIGEDLLPE
uniref:Intraflagellar transport protein 88 homolog [Monodelphis domestica] n=1 Tax=Lepeophtheirus salmonis TaxID=72036 RepID=A0A0K2V4U7_LEPSM